MHYTTEQEVVDIIIEQCSHAEGFLVRLHSFNDFNEQLYNKLYAALQQYAQMVKNREYVHRNVAGCLLALEQELVIKQNQIYGQLKNKKAIVQQAFGEITHIIFEIIPPTLADK